VLALSGGVGGAKLVAGLARVYEPGQLLIVANTGDDFEHLGLPISPDLDTVVYTLAGLADPERGWGRAGETWQCMEALAALGGPDWFRLGDRDLALHLWRRERLGAGVSLSTFTRELCERLGVPVEVVPMTDDRLATVLETDEGILGFQEYFVHRRCAPRVRRVLLEGAGSARAAPSLATAMQRDALRAVVICPSNPYLSVDPILAVTGVRDWLLGTRTTVVAVSPIIGGEALKGPAAKLLRELAGESSALAVARHYLGLVDLFVLDERDAALRPAIEQLGMRVLVTDTVMHAAEDRVRLAMTLRDALQSPSWT
jgi:LPPG:FO 2-phospho-L-lactate transferase